MTLTALRETFPARASEWALSIMLFLWSVVLSANPDLFATGMSYRSLGQIMGQDGWAVACLFVGGGRLIILAVNGAWRRSPHLRALGAFLSGLFWFMISAGIVQSGIYNTGLAVYPVLFMLDAFNAIRAMGEAGRSDQFHGSRMAKDGPHT
jgi:hypothetical protein